jgi:AbrB family looped-hinge helix DNA binding protein
MATANYIMRVDERGFLTIPKEVQDILHLRPGEEVQVSIDRIPAPTPNKKMLSILQGIQERHKDRPYTDPVDTDRLLGEARSGAMYHDESTE